jgi:AraC-like DNA-binding protein
MLEKLKLRPGYDGFLFLAEAERNPPYLKSHHHVELELNFVVKGMISYVVSGRRYTFHQGTLLWMFPRQEHRLVDRTSDAKYYVAVFRPEMIRRSCRSGNYEMLKRQSLAGGGVLNKILDPKTFSFLKRLMDEMMEGALDPDLLNREAGFGVGSNFSYEHGDLDALNAGLHYLLVMGWRCFKNGARSGESFNLHPAVKRSLQLLSGGEEVKLGEVASRCGVSEPYLSRLFHRQVGVPLNRYRNSVRLGQFMENYQKGKHKTILDCVYEAGFGSYAQFYKVFTESYGQGPRTFLIPHQSPRKIK